MRTPLLPAVLVPVPFHTAIAPAADPPEWNGLFIAADRPRAELGCYGSAANPQHLDAQAGRRVVFERAYCQQVVRNANRSSFLCGKRPDNR